MATYLMIVIDRDNRKRDPLAEYEIAIEEEHSSINEIMAREVAVKRFESDIRHIPRLRALVRNNGIRWCIDSMQI